MSESMTCCPLSDGDGDRPSCSSSATRIARKPHWCSECADEIPRGARYEYASGVWDGRPDSFKTCLSCVEIRNHFACGNGWIYGDVWSQIMENFFPDMRAGGKCMDGLSPEAKARMFEMRIEWMFESELEINGAIPPGFAVDKGGILVRVSDAPEMVSADARVRDGESSPSPAHGDDDSRSSGDSGGPGAPE